MYHEPHFFVNDEPLKATDSFTYLGITLSREANIDVEVNNSIFKANSAFGRLMKKAWDRRGISQDTKLKVYMAVVLTVLLYESESWTVYSRHVKKTQPLPYKMFADYFEHQVAQKSSYEQAPLELTLYCRKLK